MIDTEDILEAAHKHLGAGPKTIVAVETREDQARVFVVEGDDRPTRRLLLKRVWTVVGEED